MLFSDAHQTISSAQSNFLHIRTVVMVSDNITPSCGLVENEQPFLLPLVMNSTELHILRELQISKLVNVIVIGECLLKRKTQTN